MKTPDQIQKDYANSNKFDSFNDLLLDNENEIDWHVSRVQKEYAKELVSNLNLKILSIEDKNGAVFTLGDTVNFSERYKPFVLSEIKINTSERRIELHGDSLFCTLNESNCSVIKPTIPNK